MQALLPTFIPALLALAMLIVIYTDVTRYTIPNWLNLALLLIYPLWVISAPTEIDWPMGLAMAGIYLVIGFIFFALGLIGAGDAKLICVLGLFLGLSDVSMEFFIWMALIGGILSIFIMMMRRVYKDKDNKPKLFSPKAPIPYGVAVALSFIMILLRGKLPGMPGLL